MHNLTKRLVVFIITLSLMLIPTSTINAKNVYKLTKSEEKLIQKIMYLEARGHGVKGMALVGQVILNRRQSKKFPKTIKKVIYAKNQFTTAKYIHKGKITKKTKKALKQIKKGKYKNMKAVYFCHKSVYRGWWRTLKVVKRYKTHVFCK